MTSRPSQYIEDLLSPIGRIDSGIGIRSDSRKTIYKCAFSSACRQRLYKKRPSQTPGIYFLGIGFASLAVIYLLVGCFHFMRGKPKVVALSRSLAAEGNRPCQTGTSGGGEEEPQAPRHEGSSGDSDKAGAVQGNELYTTTTTRWQLLTTETSRSSEISTALTSPGELGPGAPEVEYPTKPLPQADFPADVQSAPQHPDGQETSGDQSERPKERFLEGVVGDGKDKAVLSVESQGQLHDGELWEMWGRRGLPEYARDQVMSLLQRMVNDASLCQFLLPSLTARDGLRLTLAVVRLLALDLGAISLVQDNIEPHRGELGCALVNLGSDVLERNGNDGDLEEQRRQVRELILVIGELKEPRPFTENTTSIKYRKKMTSILRTAEKVESFCMLVLDGLRMALESPRGLEPSEFERRLRVLRRLYQVHSTHIAMDASLRYYIILVQKRLEVNPLLGSHHHKMVGRALPPLQSLIEEIVSAVKNCGGLLPQPHVSSLQHHNALGSWLPTTGVMPPPYAQPQELPSDPQQQERFMQGSLPSLASAGSAELQHGQSMIYPIPLPHPQSVALPVVHWSTGPFAYLPQHVRPGVGTLHWMHPLLPSTVYWAQAPSQVFQGMPWHYPQAPTSAGSAAGQSQQALTKPMTPPQSQLQAWSLGQPTMPGVASGSSSVAAQLISSRIHNLQSFPSALSSDYRPAAASHPDPNHSRRDLRRESASVQTPNSTPFREYTLFGQSSQPWLPVSAATASQPLTSSFGPKHDSRLEGGSQHGRAEDNMVAEAHIKGPSLDTTTSGEGGQHAKK